MSTTVTLHGEDNLQAPLHVHEEEVGLDGIHRRDVWLEPTS